MDYIKNVLIPQGNEVTLLSINEDYSQYQQYYDSNNVHVFSIKLYRRIYNKVPFIGQNLAVNLLKFFLRKIGYHDSVHIHFVTPWAMSVAECFKSLFPECKYILSFHGSDIFRATRLLQKRIKPHLKYSDVITVLTVAMKEELQNQYGEVVAKAKILRFGNPNIEHIRELQKSYSRSSAKKMLGVPEKSKLVICGYKSGNALRHEEMLKQLSKLKEFQKKELYIILPLTYGGTPEYNENIEMELAKSGLRGKTIVKRMSDDEICLLRIAGDIYINIQTTDAISASMIEHLYCRAVVINGEWLDYRELRENGVIYHEIKEVNNLSQTVGMVVEQFLDCYEATEKNPQIVYSMCSWSVQKSLWHNLYLCGDWHD